jgi:hypothetical protein
MYRFARDDEIDLDELRTRLRKMTDEDLLRFGKAARFMCQDKSAREVFVIQLEEARAEWRRRTSVDKPRPGSLGPLTAAWRTLLWLASGWGCRGRRPSTA